jgi:hypothetical protein
VVTSPSVLRKFNVEADFLAPLKLDHPTVVDHQLDRPVADGLEGLPELPEERWRQREIVIWVGVVVSRNGRVSAHDPI